MNRRSTENDTEERLPPRSPVSGFLWAGLVCVAASAFVGVGAILSASRRQSDAPLSSLADALLLLMCSVPLFYAQARYLFWRRASGVIMLHFALSADPIEVKTKLVRPENLERGLIYGGLILLALIPRVLILRTPIIAEEAALVRALSTQSAVTDQVLQGYTIVAQCLVSLWEMLQGNGAASNGSVPIWLVRLPAFVCGTAAVPMLYKVVRLLLNRPIALASALMLALSPIAVGMSGRAASAAIVLFLVLAHCYFLARALRECAALAWLGWLACLVLATFFAPTVWSLVLLDAVFLMVRAVWVSSRRRLPAQGAALVEQAVVLSAAYAGFVFTIAYLLGWIFVLPKWGVPLLVAPKPFAFPIDKIISIVLIVIGFVALAVRPSAIAAYAGLVCVIGWGIGANVLVTPLLLVFLAAGIEQILRAVWGEKEDKALMREATLYLLTFLWIMLHIPMLRETIKPKPVIKKNPTAVVRVIPNRSRK